MDTSDDPVTVAMVGGAVFGVVQASKTSRPSGSGATPKAGQEIKTAEPVETLSEQAKKNRRQAASVLASRFGKPILGIPGLMGA